MEIRLQSVDQLLVYAEYFGALAGQEEQAKQMVGLVKAFSGEKGLQGVDTKRPIGLYSNVTPNVIDSQAVLMVPIADEESFLNLLRGQLSLDPRKGDDGIYSLDVPNAPFPATVYFTFAKDYLHVTVQDAKHVAAKSLIDPKVFFAKPNPAVLSVILRIQQLPVDVRKTVFGQIELQLQQQKEAVDKDEPNPESMFQNLILDTLASTMNSLLMEGDTLTLDLSVTPKSDDIALNLQLTAQEGTAFQKALRAAAERKGRAPAIGLAPGAVASIAINMGLPEETVKALNPIIDVAIRRAIQDAGPNDQLVIERVLQVLEPTLKSGEIEAGLAMHKVEKPKGYTVLAGVKMKQGEDVEKLAKEFLPFLPPDQVTMELNKETIEKTQLHRATVSNAEMKNFMGTDTIWLGTSSDLLLLNIASESKELEKIVKSAPRTTPVMAAELSAVEFMRASNQELDPEIAQAVIKRFFGSESPAGKDTVKFTVQAGDALNANFTTKGKGFMFLAEFDKAKKEAELK